MGLILKKGMFSFLRPDNLMIKASSNTHGRLLHITTVEEGFFLFITMLICSSHEN